MAFEVAYLRSKNNNLKTCEIRYKFRKNVIFNIGIIFVRTASNDKSILLSQYQILI